MSLYFQCNVLHVYYFKGYATHVILLQILVTTMLINEMTMKWYAVILRTLQKSLCVCVCVVWCVYGVHVCVCVCVCECVLSVCVQYSVVCVWDRWRQWW